MTFSNNNYYIFVTLIVLYKYIKLLKALDKKFNFVQLPTIFAVLRYNYQLIFLVFFFCYIGPDDIIPAPAYSKIIT